MMIGKLLKTILYSSPKGLIELYGLQDWYVSLDPEIKSKIKTYYALGMNCNPDHIDKGNLIDFNQKFSGCQKFLNGIGGNAISKDPAFAEFILLKALSSVDNNPIDRHFVYNSLINLYYRQREKRPDAIDLCVKYCIEDIQRIDAFKVAWISDYECIQDNLIANGHKKPEERYEVKLPAIPSFDRLRIIYEKQGKFREAIQVCSKAIEVDAWSIEVGNDQITKLMKKLTSSQNS